MNETGVLVFTLLGYVVGAVVLYFIIRLAVVHAIRATRPEPVEARREDN